MHPTDGLGFTGEHIHEIVTYINTNPATFREMLYALDCDIDWFKESFNAEATATLDKIPFKRPRDRELMEEALLIKNIRIVYEEHGKVFTIPFSNNIGIWGVTDSDDNCKLLVYAYTLTDIRNLTILTGLIFDSFLKTVVPGADVAALAEDMNQNPGGNVTCNGVRLSFFMRGDLYLYSAMNDKVPVLIEEDDLP